MPPKKPQPASLKDNPGLILMGITFLTTVAGGGALWKQISDDHDTLTGLVTVQGGIITDVTYNP